MLDLIGEYEVKLDSKGRLRIPSDLLSQLGDEGKLPFVVTRGHGDCLSLHVASEWKRTMEELRDLNRNNKKDRNYIRSIYHGGRRIALDSTDRVLIPKYLLKKVGIEKEIVVSTFQDQIEIWAKEKFYEFHESFSEGIDDMADDRLGNKNDNEQE